MNTHIQDTTNSATFLSSLLDILKDKCSAKWISQILHSYYIILLPREEIELTADKEKAKLHTYFAFVFSFKENDLQTQKDKSDEEVNVRWQ